MLFTRDRSFYRSLVTLAVPIALQNLVTFCVGLCDNVMIGALGDTAISGVYMGNQIQTLLQIFSGGIEGAILVLAAQYWGRRDKESIKKIISLGLRFTVLFGAVLSVICICIPKNVIALFTDESAVIDAGAEYLRTVAVSYVFFCLTQALIAAMRSVECARIGLYVSLVSLATNAALNYILIFGKLGAPALGIKGAAAATLVSRIVECAVMVVYTFVIDKRLRMRIRDLFVTDKGLLRDFLRYGAPIVAGQLVWATNMLSNSAIMGRQSVPGVVAALSVANTLHNLAYVVMNGMSGAVGIITGKTIGRGEERLMREYAKTTQVIFILLGLVTGGALRLLRDPYISIYNISPEAAEQARLLINVISVTIIGTCYQAACLFGLVKSGGDISFVFKNDCIFVFLVVIPSALIATALGAAPWIVFACLKCDQILKCIVAAVKINRFNWMKNLTRGASVHENVPKDGNAADVG